MWSWVLHKFTDIDRNIGTRTPSQPVAESVWYTVKDKNFFRFELLIKKDFRKFISGVYLHNKRLLFLSIFKSLKIKVYFQILKQNTLKIVKVRFFVYCDVSTHTFLISSKKSTIISMGVNLRSKKSHFWLELEGCLLPWSQFNRLLIWRNETSIYVSQPILKINFLRSI